MSDKCGTCGCDLNTVLLAGLTPHEDWCTPLREMRGTVIRLHACLIELWPHCEVHGCDKLATVVGTRQNIPAECIDRAKLCNEHASRFKNGGDVHRGPYDARSSNRSKWTVRRLRGVDELNEGNGR